jgi:hypothetical protein
MSTTSTHVDVDCPVGIVYDQWTQFEDFPRFMEGVESVQQLDDTTLRWTAEIAGQRRTWKARIVDQVPDRKVSWRSIDGAKNSGVVQFEPLDRDHTRVFLDLDFEPEGLVESTGDALGFVKRRAEGDLERFRSFLETRRDATGAWRGTVHGGETTARPNEVGGMVTGMGTGLNSGMGAGLGPESAGTRAGSSIERDDDFVRDTTTDTPPTGRRTGPVEPPLT